MVDEQVIIVDQENRELGQVKRQTMRSESLIHRASYVVVLGSDQTIFVQQRSNGKDLYPGLHEPGCAGVVTAGESYEDAALRELAEELGIKKVALSHEFDFYQETDVNRVWGRVFSCTWQGEIHLQQEEVVWGDFMTLAEIQDLVKEGKMTPDGSLIIGRLNPFFNNFNK